MSSLDQGNSEIVKDHVLENVTAKYSKPSSLESYSSFTSRRRRKPFRKNNSKKRKESLETIG